jgi:CubicO group peptidase (beta-lactamase class C family)
MARKLVLILSFTAALGLFGALTKDVGTCSVCGPQLGLKASAAVPPVLPAPPPTLRFELQEVQTLVDQTIAEAMEKEHLPGVAFALVKDGQVVISRGYGYANLEKQTPVTPDKTIFRIGSISKLFTAHAIVQLADLNKLSLDHDVNRYLAYPKVDIRYPEPVRFWHLLTHTAGFDQVGDRGREFARAEERK